MKAETNKQISLIRKFYGVEFDRPYIIKELFPFDNPTQFQSFLINSRVKKFLRLKILKKIGLDTEFILGRPEFSTYKPTLDPYYESIVDKTYPPSVSNEKFSGEEIFNMTLSNLGFRQLIVRYVNTEDIKFITEEEIIPKKDAGRFYLGNITLFSEDKDIILTPTHLYYTDDKFSDMIDYHSKIFNKFIIDKKKVAIPHDIYIRMLLMWFPNIVKTRILY